MRRFAQTWTVRHTVSVRLPIFAQVFHERCIIIQILLLTKVSRERARRNQIRASPLTELVVCGPAVATAEEKCLLNSVLSVSFSTSVNATK